MRTVGELGAQLGGELEDQTGDLVDGAAVGFPEDFAIVDEAGSVGRAVVEELDQSVVFDQLG